MTEQSDVDQVHGRVERIFITAQAGAPMQEVPEVRAIAGRGLEGDRYTSASGTWSERLAKGRRDLTLIGVEGLAEMARDGIALRPEETRRNVLTSGIELAALVGRQFRVGTAICYGIRRCQPCIYLEERTQPGVLKEMVDRGGLFTEIVRDGVIRVGDAVVPLAVNEEVSREVVSAA